MPVAVVVGRLIQHHGHEDLDVEDGDHLGVCDDMSSFIYRHQG